jgi:hypothetical protein
MAQSIEAYISCNQKVVKQWVTRACGLYIRASLESDKVTEHYINSDRICYDQRRVHKMMEVLRHYNLIAYSSFVSPPYNYYCRNNDKGHFDILIDPKAMRNAGKQYGERYDFKTDAPKSTTDRTKSYPTIQSISHEGLIHYYFNKNQYELFDRVESEGKEDPRRIRIYPKSLESKAERAVFTEALERYYSSNMDAFVEVMFGFKPEVLMTYNKDYYSAKTDKSILKNLDVERVNDLDFDSIDRDDIREKLADAKRLQEYADASVRDLEKLVKLVPTNHEKIMKTFLKTAEVHLSKSAPMLINDTDPKLKSLAALILKGSNKGLL